jgi:transposase
MGQLKTYSSDLTDAEWARIAPLLPADKLVGRVREVDLRDVLDAIFDRVENGVKWRHLPADFPPWQTVYGYFRVWVRLGLWESINAALVRQVRRSVGRAETPSLGIIDSQSVRLGEKGGRQLASMGAKRSKGENAPSLLIS